MNIMAIDLGKFNSVVCNYNKTMGDHSFQTVSTDRGYFKTMLKTSRPDLVVVEACGPSGWVGDLCEELKIQLIVCSTNEVAWLFKNVKRKTGKNDALKLARLAVMSELTPTHVPSKAVREHRRLITYRKKIVD